MITDNKINAAIAEVSGWTAIWGEGRGPDYCNDLNEMHKAEQILWLRDYTLRQRFIEKLAAMLNKSEWRKMEAVDMLDLTARERAEGLLRTLGKWEEEQK